MGGWAVMALARAGSAERVCLCASLPNSAFSGLVLVACSLPPADGCIHTEFTPRKTAVVTNQGSSRRPLPSRFPPELVVNRLPAQRCRHEIGSVSRSVTSLAEWLSSLKLLFPRVSNGVLLSQWLWDCG